ncbi:MAG: hypothetical protein NTX86_03670 [Candidatus Dependentiae bacterium]|nr:hypothetical protein [Candidatus Dependentiae bacterium]
MKRFLLLVICCIATSTAQATEKIESIRDTIVSTLKHTNPTTLAQFNEFYKQYEQSVFEFFDPKNELPLTQHIERMNQDLKTLKGVYDNPQFKSVRPNLLDLNNHFIAMVAILKQYIGSRNSIGMALNVRPFKFLLPAAVKNRGNISLFKSLHHRLTC